MADINQMSTESGDSDHLLTESKPDSVQHDETMAAEIPDTKTDQSSESTTDQPELVESEKSTTDQPERVESEKSTTDQPELVESEKSTTDQPERVEGEKSTEIQFYGSHFHQLIDPEPSVASLFKLQMTRCVERTVQCHALLREADKLIRAESVAADALGKLGMEYADTNLKGLCDIASIRTIAAMKLEDGLVQAKSRLQTLGIAIQAANEAEMEHEQGITTHLKNADSGRVIAARGRAHQTKLEALVSAAQLSSFQVEFKNAIGSFLSTVAPESEIELLDVQNINKKANQLNTQVMEALQATHYTLGANSNGPPRGWLNYRTRGLPFSAWQRIFFFIQDCHLMKQTREEINANLFLDFNNCTVEDCQVDDRANTFVVRAQSGNYYFQAESFESAIAWRVTIESLISAAKYEENSPQIPDELANEVTRGRSSSSSDGWMSNLTGNIKSAFTNLKSASQTAVDQLEQKLATIDRPSQATSPVHAPAEIDPSELDNIVWTIPQSTSSAAPLDGKSIECRFLGSHKSALSDGGAICDLIQKVRTQYEVPSPPLCGITVHPSAVTVAIYPVDEKEKSAVTNLINFIPLGGDLSGLLVDCDDHAEVWLLQGLDLTSRLQELFKTD